MIKKERLTKKSTCYDQITCLEEIYSNFNNNDQPTLIERPNSAPFFPFKEERVYEQEYIKKRVLYDSIENNAIKTTVNQCFNDRGDIILLKTRQDSDFSYENKTDSKIEYCYKYNNDSF